MKLLNKLRIVPFSSTFRSLAINAWQQIVCSYFKRTDNYVKGLEGDGLRREGEWPRLSLELVGETKPDTACDFAGYIVIDIPFLIYFLRNILTP